jgi:hypothetical protein
VGARSQIRSRRPPRSLTDAQARVSAKVRSQALHRPLGASGPLEVDDEGLRPSVPIVDDAETTIDSCLQRPHERVELDQLILASQVRCATSKHGKEQASAERLETPWDVVGQPGGEPHIAARGDRVIVVHMSMPNIGSLP